MVKSVKTQGKVGAGIDRLWKALAKDLKNVVPKMIPNLVKEVQVVEGEGGLGTVYLFQFGPDVKSMTYQKEKLSELDESVHRMSLEVVEGGHLNLGFSFYQTTYQLISAGEHETLIEATVTYESQNSEIEENTMATKTTSSMSAYIKCLENYLVNGGDDS